MSDEGNPWRLVSQRLAYETPWIRVFDQKMVDPVGKEARYGIVRFNKRATGVLPIDDEGRVHLIGQWRVPLDLYSWEMPEGGCDAGETPEEAARRELEEEAGLHAGTMVEILRMHLSNSVTDEFAHIYIAYDLTAGEAAPEPVEVLKRRTARFTEVLREAVDGRITDAITVAAVLRAYHMAKTGALPEKLAVAMLREDDNG